MYTTVGQSWFHGVRFSSLLHTIYYIVLPPPTQNIKMYTFCSEYLYWSKLLFAGVTSAGWQHHLKENCCCCWWWWRRRRRKRCIPILFSDHWPGTCWTLLRRPISSAHTTVSVPIAWFPVLFSQQPATYSILQLAKSPISPRMSPLKPWFWLSSKCRHEHEMTLSSVQYQT